MSPEQIDFVREVLGKEWRRLERRRRRANTQATHDRLLDRQLRIEDLLKSLRDSRAQGAA